MMTRMKKPHIPRDETILAVYSLAAYVWWTSSRIDALAPCVVAIVSVGSSSVVFISYLFAVALTTSYDE